MTALVKFIVQKDRFGGLPPVRQLSAELQQAGAMPVYSDDSDADAGGQGWREVQTPSDGCQCWSSTLSMHDSLDHCQSCPAPLLLVNVR